MNNKIKKRKYKSLKSCIFVWKEVYSGGKSGRGEELKVYLYDRGEGVKGSKEGV